LPRRATAAPAAACARAACHAPKLTRRPQVRPPAAAAGRPQHSGSARGSYTAAAPRTGCCSVRCWPLPHMPARKPVLSSGRSATRPASCSPSERSCPRNACTRPAVLGGSPAHWRPAAGARARACFARPPRVRSRPPPLRAGCSGKRRRTDFLPLSAFDERALLSDYRFLEEAAAAGEAAQRAAPARGRAAPPPHLQELAHQVRAPARAARRAARAPGRNRAARRRRLAPAACAGARRALSSLCGPRAGWLCRRRVLRICSDVLATRVWRPAAALPGAAAGAARAQGRLSRPPPPAAPG